jgi:hypothetical protein
MKFIIMGQKQNCNRCKALYNIQNHIHCELGYNIIGKADKLALVIYDNQIFPQEPCPKPLTNDDLIECLEIYKAEQWRR